MKFLESNKLLPAFTVILLVSTIFLWVKYKNDQAALRAYSEIRESNERVLAFARLFMEHILKAKTEVDVKTLLQLEDAARNTGDDELQAQWQKFLASKTEAEAQREVRNLLEVVVKKIR